MSLPEHHLPPGSVFKLAHADTKQNGGGYIPAPGLDWSFAVGKLFVVKSRHLHRAWNYIHGFPVSQSLGEMLFKEMFRSKRTPSVLEWGHVRQNGFVIDADCIGVPTECGVEYCGNFVLVENDYLCESCRSQEI